MDTRKPEPDCTTCWKREDCPIAEEGDFCPAWQSRKPEPAGEDPSERWRRGDDLYEL